MKAVRWIVFFLCAAPFLSVKGQPVPQIYVFTNANPSPGYIFLSTFRSGSQHPNYLFVLDKNGKTVLEKKLPLEIDGSYLDFKKQPGDRYSFFNQRTRKFYVMDKYFAITDSITAQNGYETDGHDLIITDDNHYFLMGLETRTVDMTPVIDSGKTDAQVQGVIIQELDASKKVLFEWKTLDHLPVTDCIGQNLAAATIDYIHTNAIWVDTDSTLIMSNRHFNELTRISLKTGDIIWRMGSNAKNNQFTFIGDTMGFSYQHCARVLPNGHILLFDNGNNRKNGIKFSRAVEYAIDEKNKTATLVWQYRNTPDNTSGAMGSVQRLDNGNTLIGWGISYPNVTEVDSAGHKLFEMSFAITSKIYTYRAFKYDIDNPVTSVLMDDLISQKGILVYPNPSNGEFIIKAGSNKPVKVTIVNTLGQVVLESSITGAEKFSGLKSGVYTVLVNDDGAVRQEKVVVY